MTLRRAVKADEKFILSVRNDPDVRANSRTDNLKDGWWYDQRLGDLKHRLYVVEVDGKPIGYGALQLFTPSVAEISIAIAKEYRGQGHGSTLIRALTEEGRRFGVTRFLATVRGANIASLRSFLTEQFTPTKWVYLERIVP